MPRRGTAIARHFQCLERVDLYGPRAEGTVDSSPRAISLGVNSAVAAGLLEPKPDFPAINRRSIVVVSLPGQGIKDCRFAVAQQRNRVALRLR
jgi:hypothetical protein